MSNNLFLDDDLQPLAAEVAGIADVFRDRAAENDRLARFPAENFADLSRAGLLGLAVPPELGGRGGSYLAFSVVAEEIARGDASTCLCFAMHCAGVAAVLAGDDTHRQRAVERLARRGGMHVTGGVLTMHDVTDSSAGGGAAAVARAAHQPPPVGVVVVEPRPDEGYEIGPRRYLATVDGDALQAHSPPEAYR